MGHLSLASEPGKEAGPAGRRVATPLATADIPAEEEA